VVKQTGRFVLAPPLLIISTESLFLELQTQTST
jgi:hypothetical protein